MGGRPTRVAFVTDRIGTLSAAEAGESLAAGWMSRRPDDDLVVVPLGASGAGLAEAYAALVQRPVSVAPAVRATGADRPAADATLLLEVAGPEAVLVAVESAPAARVPGVDPSREASSWAWGEAIARALAEHEDVRRLVVDLGGMRARDGGAGLLAALGATADVPLDRGIAGLTGLTTLDLTAPRAALAGIEELVAVVPADQADRVLLGIQGVTSLHGVVLREQGLPWDPADLLAADATLQRLAALASPRRTDAPGLGACGGVAYALAALGATVTTGPAWLAGLTGLEETLAAADVVVTGSGAYDFAHRGGETVEAVVGMAGRAMRPVVAVAGYVTISAREMRAHGLDAAYAVHDGVPGASVLVDRADLEQMGRRIARTWAGATPPGVGTPGTAS
ncbi:glycerate kinase [Raineyella sp. LH-20]|uniref:glycerate kinase n=1 Tax=Raineyella sp. LH-20 TaxID=3081204 RepID=UPI002952CD95|nr:glycerate kinase [Raineyella sp. LH-20]WOP17602.1 glycerate kinase [Raineyella sp. LH-20]